MSKKTVCIEFHLFLTPHYHFILNVLHQKILTHISYSLNPQLLVIISDHLLLDMLQAPGISIKNLSADRIAKQIIQTVKDTKEQREF